MVGSHPSFCKCLLIIQINILQEGYDMNNRFSGMWPGCAPSLCKKLATVSQSHYPECAHAYMNHEHPVKDLSLPIHCSLCSAVFRQKTLFRFIGLNNTFIPGSAPGVSHFLACPAKVGDLKAKPTSRAGCRGCWAPGPSGGPPSELRGHSTFCRAVP